MHYLLHDLLRNSALLYPENIAVRFKNSDISYRNLDLQTSQLASYLSQKGVKPKDRVGIYIDKSIDSIIAIFGILKSGACYVPLDPMAPPERQALIIRDCSLEFLISSSKKIAHLHKVLNQETYLKHLLLLDITRDEFHDSIAGVDIACKNEIFGTNRNILEESTRKQSDSELAYILYTSGSTGQPKGVMISHRASMAFVDWSYKCFSVNSDDNVSAHAPFHFDLSIFDIYVTIKAGATICIIPQGLSAFPTSLADFIEKEKLSIWYSTPTILIQLLLYGRLETKDFSVLKQILFAGEVFPLKYLKELLSKIPSAKYFNLYGPTETNVCTYYPVSDLSMDSDSIPVGKPCEGQEIFVVDGDGSLAKEGEIGELYVSGPTLMRGYWNDPVKTESVLLDNIFGSGTKKVYRTGDLVRINSDGNLEYHGRRDNMIKSRGYRIELGEIESVMSAHPDIGELAVIGLPDINIGKKIVAVVSLNQGSKITEETLKLYCSQKLPTYMVPEAIFIKNCLPKTSTNKIDRKRLEQIYKT
ncbi:amino acid adenylation domain-containing protein [Acidobacteriota bacterium]